MSASSKRVLVTLAAIALLAVGIAGCGGGGGDDPPDSDPPTPQDVDLSDVTSGFMAEAGTVEIEAGESEDHGDITFACASDGDDCTVMVMVADDGTITATSTGGMVTAMNSDAYRMRIEPQNVALSAVTTGFMAVAGTVEIEAGQSEDHGDITFACAAGGDDCTVTVMVADDGTITATSTGGMVTAMNSDAYRMRIEPQNVALSGVTSGFMAVAGTINIEAGESEDHGDITFSCAAGGVDCTVVVAVANDGTITATSTGGIVTAKNSDAYHMRIVPQDVALSGLTIGYLAKAGTINIDAGESENQGDIRFSCASGGADCRVVVTVADDGVITAMSTGGVVSAANAGDPNPPAVTALDEVIGMGTNQSVPPTLDMSGAPADGSGFVAMADSAIADIEGWPHSKYVLENMASGMTPASTETLVIYRNTDYETDTPFADVYPFDVDDDSDTLDDSISLAGRDLSLMGGSDLDNEWSDGETSPGRFDGATGVYTCRGSCTLTFDSNGNVTNVSGNMHFTPDAGAEVQAPDPAYIYFGYWIEETTSVGVDPDFALAGVYGGEEASVFGDIQQLEGEATYEGAATGLYARRWTDSDGDVVRRRSGQFTADASLAANFGGPSVRQVDHYSISGTITNFMDGDRIVDANWRLALERADFGPGSSAANGVFLGQSQDVDADGDPIEGPADMGGWEGQFFGEVDVDADDGMTGNQSTLPTGVVGTFDGQFNNGVVVGAFGAENVE